MYIILCNANIEILAISVTCANSYICSFLHIINFAHYINFEKQLNIIMLRQCAKYR